MGQDVSCIQSRWTPTLVENVGIEPLLLCPRQACNRYTAFSIFRTDGLNFTHRHFSSFRAVNKRGRLTNEKNSRMVLHHRIELWSRAYKARALTTVLIEFVKQFLFHCKFFSYMNIIVFAFYKSFRSYNKFLNIFIIMKIYKIKLIFLS